MTIHLSLLSLIGFLGALLIVYISVPSIVNVARIKGLFDEPGLRKCHRHKTPNLGGIAIFAGIVVMMGLLLDTTVNKELYYLIAAITVMFFVGIKDDILIIAPRKKLLGEIFSVLILVVLGNLRFTSLHGFLGINNIDYIPSLLLSSFVMIVIINGFNLIDGVDGLASGIGIVVSLTFGVWFYLTGFANYAVLSAIVAGALVAFFGFNVFGKTNKVFMGDTGSLILGLIISVLVIRFNEANITYNGIFSFQSSPAVSFGILIIPMFDTMRIFLLRILKGQSPFKPDMNHLHHRILKLGFSHVEVTLIISIANLFFILLMLAFKSIGLLPLMVLNISVATILMLMMEWMVKRRDDKYQGNSGLQMTTIKPEKIRTA